jgi:hypothetical protein
MRQFCHIQKPLVASYTGSRTGATRSRTGATRHAGSSAGATRWLALMLFLSIASSATAAEWPDTRTVGPFVCRADFSLQDIGPFLAELSQLQNDLVQALRIPPAREVVEIYLFHDQQTYERYLKQQFPNVPFRRAVYIKGNGPGRVFAYRSAQFDIDLRHECTHALLHASLKNIPLWLDEGLAGYFELPAEKRAFDNPHFGSIRWNVWLGTVPSLDHLEKCTEISKMGKSEYRDSWAWICFMLNGPAEAHDELIHYIYDLQSQNPPDLLCERIKRGHPSLQQSFVSYFRKWKNEQVTQLGMHK